MNKNSIFTATAFVALTLISVSCAAQNNISLPKPSKSLKTSVVEALQNRHSEREFSEKQFSNEDLSSLLWAANGVNRVDGKRTAPSAINAQDIDIYVVRADGAYLYDAQNNALKQVSTEDLRPAVAGRQDFAKVAPVSLVLVSDGAKFGDHPNRFGLADAAYVSENICIYCSAAGWACVPRASMDNDALKKGLQLTEKQELCLNNVIGYRK